MAETCMLVTTELTTAIRSFYKEVFGWKELSSGTGWVAVEAGPGKGGLISAPIADGELAGWHPCVAVEEINATLVNVVAQAGVVIQGKTDWPAGNGSYAIIQDPQGALLVIRN